MTAARHERTPAIPSLDSPRPDARHSAPVETAPLPPSEPAPRRTPAPHNNLSLPRSPLIGRTHEIAVIQQLLLQEHIGLLTLTGPGGIGKTRLAMQVVVNLLDHFVDGVYFVSLAPISDPDLVGAAIAQTLGVREAPGRTMQESLQEYLSDKQLLLVLDNFEQILPAAPLVSTLLNACLRLKVLVTSRATLHLYGEQEFPVPPLALPDAKHLTTSLNEYAAIDLFCQRARAVRPDFALIPANAVDVAKICLGLDGLPLAIELAAARIRLFSPSALLARLNQRLTLLTDGPHDMPTRQRTLRDEIAWSYDLLTANEQTLFRRLAVFVGGFTLETAHAVCNAEGDLTDAVLDGIARLVDHNLLKQVVQGDSDPRLGMLETIREYGLEQLAVSGELENTRRHHTHYFLALVETIAPTWRGANQGLGMTFLTVEYNNLRTALAWSQAEGVGPDITLRLAGAIAGFWLVSGYWSEGRRWLEDALVFATTERTEVRAQVLIATGFLALAQGDLSIVHRHFAEGMTIAREYDAQPLIADALGGLAWMASLQQNHELAWTQLSEALAIARTLGDKYRTGWAITHLGSVACAQHDYLRAKSLYEEGKTLFQEVGAEWDIASAFAYLGKVAQHQHDYLRAGALFKESLARWRTLGILQWKGIADCLQGLVSVCTVQRKFTEAARLFGAAEALRQRLSPFFRNFSGDEIAALRTELGDAIFVSAWAEGRMLSSEQAIDYALALPEISTSVTTFASPLSPAGLTAREVEVLRLLVQGLTYAQIAEQLVVSRRTVNAHATSIYSKLGVTSRAMATRLATEQHLV